MRKLYLKKLPAGRYKFLVKFHGTSEAANIRNYLKNGFGPNRVKVKTYYNHEYLDSVFVENKAQLLKLKLIFPEEIRTIMEIVVIPSGDGNT